MLKRTVRVCPYLAAVHNPGIRVSAPDVANACYAVSSRERAHIPLDFQASTCLAGQFRRCSSYRTEVAQTRQLARRLFLAGGTLVTMAVLAGCALLAFVALILVTQRPGLLARVTDTPQPTPTPQPTATPQPTDTPPPTATASSTVTPMDSQALTGPATNTATATPQPPSPTATVTSVRPTRDEFYSPLPTPTVPPPATRRPLPTATHQPVPTSTLAPTRTPAATSTRAPTATTRVYCRTGDTMTFVPAVPAPDELFIIEVRSFTGYADISLTGPGSPRFNGVKKEGSYFVWRWEEDFATAGSYTFSFHIGSGAATCVTAAVTVAVPTNTPTPTPTPSLTPTVAPEYGLNLTLIGGDDFRPIFTDTEPVIFELSLKNTGNITDSFEIGLDADPPQDWTVQYCVGDSCSDHGTPGTQVTLPAGGSQGLSIKLIASPDAQAGYTLPVTLWARSLGDVTKQKSRTVTVVVANR